VHVTLSLPDSHERDDLVDWLHLCQSAMEGHLLNFLVRPGIQPLLGVVLARAISTFLCLVDEDFANSLSTDVIASAINPFEDFLLFDPLLIQLYDEGTKIDDKLALWLTFISTLSNSMCQRKQSCNWSVRRFLLLNDSLRLGRRVMQTEDVLRHFLYLDSMQAHLGMLCCSDSHANLPWDKLAALPEVYSTVYSCIHTVLVVQAGERILIRGATSTIGQAALHLAVNTGLHVTASTRRADHFELLKSWGA
jgi:hypothetical protein